MKKFKNKDRFKNAAYYTLSSENYTPKVSSLFLCFRSSGLGIFDSFFNAMYMYACEKDYRAQDEVKKRYGDVAMHPHGYSKEFIKATFWSGVLSVMSFIPKIYALPSKISAARRTNRAKRENSFKKCLNVAGFLRRRAPYILPILMAVFVGTYIYNVYNTQLVINVLYNGKDMGIVENRKVLEDSLRAVEETLSENAGVSVKLSDNVSYSVSKSKSPQYVSSSTLYTDILTEAKKDYTTAYGLYIDGTFVATLENKAEIETVLDEISGEDTKIANSVQILKQEYPKHAVKSGEQLKEILGPSPEVVVMSTDPMSAQEAQQVSEASQEPIPTVIRNIPAPVDSDFSNAYSIEGEKTLELTYKTERQEEKFVTEEFATEYEYDLNMYTTSSYVKQYGVDGVKRIVENVVYVNGTEQSRTFVSEEYTTETVNKVIVKGIKPIPESIPEGSEEFMLWPIDAVVNEPFGWRQRGSSMEYHKGIDMSSPRGTPIIAAASGVVEKAGEYNNGYGIMAIIRHGEGKETFYAHMNAIYVSVGDVVTQGTIIGEVGSTGDSTGNHLHFEVRIDDTPVDPVGYLMPKGE